MKEASGFDALCRVLRKNPDFQHARLVEARARIKELEQIVDELVERLSETRQTRGEA